MAHDGADEAQAILMAVTELAATGRAFSARGWVPATSGNFSRRIGEAAVLVTASGTEKGELTPADFLRIDLDGAPLDELGPRPSAEAPLHGAIYRRFAGARAVLHVHAPATTAISLGRRDAVTLTGYEMLKALAGVTTHEHVETIPIVPNDQDTTRLAAAAGDQLDRTPDAHAYLIAGHGLYTWGSSVAEARRHVEALEFLFECELRRGEQR
jgi:methylthioribulose-1-phosphate dehydratase